MEVYIIESFSAYIPSNMVRRFCLDANTSASIYSFQMLTKLNTEIQISPGCTSGSVILKKQARSPGTVQRGGLPISCRDFAVACEQQD